LQLGATAPFQGVLVNPDHYRLFTIDHDENLEFKSNENMFVKCEPAPLIAKGTTVSFLVGLLVGAASVGLFAVVLK